MIVTQTFMLHLTLLAIILFFAGCGGQVDCDAVADSPDIGQHADTADQTYTEDTYMTIARYSVDDGVTMTSFVTGPHAEFLTNVDPITLFPKEDGVVWEVLRVAAEHIWNGGIFSSNVFQLYTYDPDDVLQGRLPFYSYGFSPAGAVPDGTPADNKALGNSLANAGAETFNTAGPRSRRSQAIGVRMLIADADDDPPNSSALTVTARRLRFAEYEERFELLAVAGDHAAIRQKWADGAWQLAGIYIGDTNFPATPPPSIFPDPGRYLIIDGASNARLTLLSPGVIAPFSTLIQSLSSPVTLRPPVTMLGFNVVTGGCYRFAPGIPVGDFNGVAALPTEEALTLAEGTVFGLYGRQGSSASWDGTKYTSEVFDPSPPP